jgi:tRNA dimethylallyltransferase
MYLTALVQGLAALPPRNEKLREQLDREDLSTLFQRLQQSDPLSASRIHPNDRIRITRALETIQQTGVPHGEHQGSHQFREVALPALMIVLVWEREELQRRIALRTSQMVRDGLLAEARTILNQYGPDAQLFRSIGYREASQVLRGELPEERLAEAVVVATRQLAKRQMTFWRNEPVKRGWKVAPIEGAQGTTTVGAVLDEGATKRARLNARGTTVFRWSFDELRQRIFDFQPHDTPEVWFLDGEAISTSLRFCVAGT